MKTIFTILLATLTGAIAYGQQKHSQQAINMEKQQIIKTVQSIFENSDQRNWEQVEKAFSNKVLLDYTSMAGGEPVTLTPQQITGAWKSVLPGFESTHHQVGQFEVHENGQTAQVNARGIALHYLPNDSKSNVWVVVGSYEFNVAKEANTWRVTSMKFNLKKQEGNLELPKLAEARAKQNGTGSRRVIPAQQKAVIEKFFTSLERLDVPSFLTTWADDGRQLMPLSPENFPKLLNGKNAIQNQYKGLPDSYTSMSFPRTYFATSDPNLVIVQYAGIIPLKSGGEYNNNYVGMFKIENNRIKEFTEYFDPFILEEAFGTNLQNNFNVNTKKTNTMKQVEFTTQGLVAKGNLYLPENFDGAKKYPAVVVTGSWTTVKEQMPALYAQALAQRGFIALTFDFRYFGESEGEPREYENPSAKIEDIRNAVTYLTQLPYVDTQAIGGVGVCASTGYMSYAAASDPRIKTVVLLAPWLHNAQLVEAVYGSRPGGVKGLIEESEKAAREFASTGKTSYVVAASTTDNRAAMFIPDPVYDYYLNPQKGAVPQWKNNFAVMSWKPWLTFDGVAAGKDVRQPTLLVHSEGGAIPSGAKEFYEQLPGEKKFVWVNKKWNQLDMYYQPEAIKEVVEPAVEWLKSRLQSGF